MAFRPYPKQPNQNARFIRLFYHIAQALHHISILENQANGGYPTKGFLKQVDLLSKFVKPAKPSQAIFSRLLNINKSWAKFTAQALIDHYRASISESLGQISAHHFSQFQIQTFSATALDWARKNFRNKLREGTISEFQKIFPKSSKPAARPNPSRPHPASTPFPPLPQPNPSPPHRLPHPSPASPTNSDPPSPSPSNNNPTSRIPSLLSINTHTPADPTFTVPNRRGRSSQPKSNPNSKQITTSNRFQAISPTNPPGTPSKRKRADSSTSPPQTPSKTHRSRSVQTPNRTRRSLSVKPTNKPKSNTKPTPSSSNPSSPTQPRKVNITSPTSCINRHPNTSNKSDWSLPAINKPILVIGASNLSRISRCEDPNVQIESFPGAKIRHIIQLFQNYSSLSLPTKIIVNIGINDRSNSDTNEVFKNLCLLREVIRQKIPAVQLFFTTVPISDILTKQKAVESSNLQKLNLNLSKLKNKVTTTLDDRIPGGTTFGGDGIHWTESTANGLLAHWLSTAKKTPGFFV